MKIIIEHETLGRKVCRSFTEAYDFIEVEGLQVVDEWRDINDNIVVYVE